MEGEMIDAGKPWQWQPMTEEQAKEVIAQLKPHLHGGWKARVNCSVRANDGREIWSVTMCRHSEGLSTARADIHVNHWIQRIYESAGKQVYQPALL